MRRIAANRLHARPYRIAHAIQLDPAPTRTKTLNGVARRARRLITDKQHRMSLITQHCLQVIDHPPPAGHAAGGNHHCGSATAGKIAHGLLVFGVLIHGVKVVKRQWVSASAQTPVRLGVPPRLELAISLGEARRQRRIDYHLQLAPALILGTVYQTLQLVQQLLSAPYAEGRHNHRSAVGQGTVNRPLQPHPALPSALVLTVAIGALKHGNIGPPWRLWRWQQGRIGRPQVPRKHHPAIAPAAAVKHIRLDIGRAENMARPLQAHPQTVTSVIYHRVPHLIVERHQLLTNLLQKAPYQSRITGKTNLQRILYYQRQQTRRRNRANNRPPEPRRQQIGQTPNVVDVHMRHHQGQYIV